MENKELKLLNELSNGSGKSFGTNKEGKIEVKSVDTKGNVITTEPTSELINTLSKRVLEQDLNTANQDYFTNKWFNRRFVANGMLDKLYEVAIAPADEGSVITDSEIKNGFLDKGNEIVVEETFELIDADTDTYQYHIWDKQVSDFGVNPNKAVSVIALLASAKNRAFGKKSQIKILKAITDNITEAIQLETFVNTQDATTGYNDAIAKNQKLIRETMIKYGTENNSVITDIINGTQYIFDNTFKANDFYMLINADYEVNYAITPMDKEFNVKGYGYNMGNFAGVEVKDFDILIGTNSELVKYEILLISKKAIDLLAQFTSDKLLGTEQAYSKGKIAIKQNAFKVKAQPIIGFLAPSAVSKTKKTKKEQIIKEAKASVANKVQNPSNKTK